MDAQSVTLIVAAVAATASLANMGVNIFFSRKATREEQFRDLLKPHIIQLGEELHQVVACCFTIAKRVAAGQSTDQWSAKAHAACGRLKELNRRVKYPLESIGDGIRELTRLAGWIGHTAGDSARRDKLLAAAEELRVEIDTAVRESYLSGQPPPLTAARRVQRASQSVRAIWDAALPEEEPDTLQPLLPTGERVLEPGSDDEALADPRCGRAMR